MTLKIIIIDYDIGNVRSIKNALEKVGVQPVLSRDKETILNADGIVLPGVGAFAHAMKMLHNYTLVDILSEYVQSGAPLLGICLGMQMLLDESDEFGLHKGLGFVEGKVVQLPVQDSSNAKLPHISWNVIQSQQTDWTDTILQDVSNGSDMYFIHSYIAVPTHEKEILSYTEYSDFNFCSSLKKDNIYGCQFHPEKSGINGLKIIENYANICRSHKNA